MKPAPPFGCARCGRRLGKAAAHFLIEGGRIVCSRCLDRPAHADLFPACDVRYHDVLDHERASGTRAGIAAHLGLWP